jgi:hypothetical protein
MINNLKALHERITALENRVAELEAGPGRPKVQPLQKGTINWVDGLSIAIARITNGANHGTP